MAFMVLNYTSEALRSTKFTIVDFTKCLDDYSTD